MNQSTKKVRSRKAVSDRPKKPYPTFPLTPHASGAWMKKINGTIRYFGRWGRTVNGVLTRIEGDGWKEALELYKAQADDLHAGRTPRTKSDDNLTVMELCNRFLTAKRKRLESGEISARMFSEYRQTTDFLFAHFGKTRLVDDLTPSDFEALRNTMAKRWGPVRLGNEVGKVKTVFKFALGEGLIKTPVRMGDGFAKPTAKTMRLHRAANAPKMLEPEEIAKLLESASVTFKAMILVGLNCGFGNHDVALLPLSAVDLDSGWITFPRPKTGINRRCPLWPQTVEALRKALAERPEPRQPEAEGLVFLTARGRQWLSAGIAHPVAAVMADLLKSAGVHKRGLGFYTLRHVFRTIADEARDPVAINGIMGHSDPSMGAVYRERVADSRLLAVTEHVRGWLFPSPAVKPSEAPGTVVANSPRLKIVG